MSPDEMRSQALAHEDRTYQIKKIDLNEKLKVLETEINFICIIVNDSEFRVQVTG